MNALGYRLDYAGTLERPMKLRSLRLSVCWWMPIGLYVVLVDSTFPSGFVLGAVYALLDCSHMTVAFIFQYLLINVKLRFHLINHMLR